MLLIYLDESGINYQKRNGLYIDGPFLIFGSMFVYEDVYWSLERLFCKLIDSYFGIDNWIDNEVHATDIWHGNHLSNHLDVEERRKFFDEFLQLCGKFGLHYVFSHYLKHNTRSTARKNLALLRTSYALLLGIEHNLAEIHQTGVLVCDTTTGAEKLKIKDIAGMDVKKTNLTPAQALLKQFHAMTLWRSQKQEMISAFPIRPKYPTEAMSAYLIDRVHFLPSDDSLFLQMCDILTFITQRALVNDYLHFVAPDRVDPNKLPITQQGISTMRNKMHIASFDDARDDVTFSDASVVNPDADASFVIDFALTASHTRHLPEHYAEMQPKQESEQV